MKQGWEIKKLGEVCKVIAGLSPEGKYYNNSGNGLPFYQGKKEYGEKFIGEPTTWTSKTTKEADPGDILMSVRAPVGPINFSTQKICIGRGLAAIRASKLIDRDFLYNFLLKHENEIVGNTGAVFNSISKNQIEAIEIPLPPLPEQQRIVAILDEAFVSIAKAKANAEQNLKNAKELFDSYLQSVFANKRDGWKEKSFGDIIITLTDYHANGSYEILRDNVDLKYNEDFAWMVRSTDFENEFKNDFRYIDEKSYNFLKKSKLFGGELIMSKIGNAGKVYLMPKTNKPCSLAMNLFLIRVDEKTAVPEFVFQYLKSSEGEYQIKSRLLGMATKTITKDNVRSITIPLPSLSTQQTIIKKLDTLSTETKKLEAIYQQKINGLEELKKSVLQKAFNGELKT